MSATSSYATLVSFKCNLCPSSFNTPQQINQHLKDKHSCKNNNIFKGNNEIQQLQELMSKMSKIPKCKVITCNYVGRDENGLLEHIFKSHFPEISLYSSCDYCEKTCNQKNSLAQHMRDRHGVYIADEEDLSETIEIICKICPDYVCSNKNTFLNHMKRYHPDLAFACPYSNCDYSTKKFWKFPCHLEEHLTKEFTYYECPGCSDGFPKYDSMIQHYTDKQNWGDSEHTYDINEYPAETFNEIYCTLCDHKYDYDEDDEDQDFYSDFYDHIENSHGINIPEGIEKL